MARALMPAKGRSVKAEGTKENIECGYINSCMQRRAGASAPHCARKALSGSSTSA